MRIFEANSHRSAVGCVVGVLMMIWGVVAQAATPGYARIRNFAGGDYESGTQCWAVTTDALGRVLVANRDGLLRFDGARWQRMQLPNFTTVRSIYYDSAKNQTYVGGSGEFGYFTHDASGREKYISLISSVPAKKRNFSEVWHIFPDEKGNILFFGDYCCFRYDGKKSTPIDFKEKISVASKPDKNIYVATESGRIYTMKEKAKPLAGVEALLGKKIVGFLPTPDHRLIIVTAFDALYIYGGGALAPFPTHIDKFLKENQLFCCAEHHGQFAFGTVNMGAVMITPGESTWQQPLQNEAASKWLLHSSYINRATGLRNNTVLGIGFDCNNCLWLCLDDGVAVADTDSAVGNLLGASGEIGAGYTSMLCGGALLLGTNQALFSLPYPMADSPQPSMPQKILSGQVWSLDTIGTTLFIGDDTGLHMATLQNPHNIVRIEGVPGTWSVRKLRHHPGYALASTYNKFYLLRRENGGWKNLGKIGGFSDIGGKFEEDEKGDIWIAHWLKGVYRLTLDSTLRKWQKVVLFNSKHGLPSDRNNSVALYAGKIIIMADGGIYTIGKRGRAEHIKELERRLPLYLPAHLHTLPASAAAPGALLAISPKMVWLSKGSILDSISLRRMAKHLIPGFEHIGIAGGEMIVSSQEGFYRVNLTQSGKKRSAQRVYIASVRTLADSLIYMAQNSDAQKAIRVSHDLNSLRFEFALPEYRDEKGVMYACRLEGYDADFTPFSTTPWKEYTHLDEKNYTLHVRALNNVTGEITETAFEFKVLPPWYRTIWANIVYAIVILMAFYGAYRLIAMRMMRMERERENALMQAKERAEQEALRKDFEIAALKGEQLEQDIKHKSSELSNITMNVIRKNEILLDVAGRLERLRNTVAEDEVAIRKGIEKIVKMVKENISHDDDWKNFYQNFDIVYENFTKRLMERHPDLTKTELRICCYLKMGLSSKDIAPLFNISPRSVEMTRYRLRKKLGLTRDMNLTAYLSSADHSAP